MKMPDLSRGRCRGLDPEMFYPGKDDPNSIAEAKKICDNCPVKSPCLEWALRHEKWGLWGGMSEKQRKKERKRRKLAFLAPEGNWMHWAEQQPCGTHAGYRRHLKEGTPTCVACKSARAEVWKRYRDEKSA